MRPSSRCSNGTARGETYEAVVTDALALIRLAGEASRGWLSHRDRIVEAGRAERLTVAEAFSRYAGIDLLAGIAPGGEDRPRAPRHGRRRRGA